MWRTQVASVFILWKDSLICSKRKKKAPVFLNGKQRPVNGNTGYVILRYLTMTRLCAIISIAINAHKAIVNFYMFYMY